MTNEKAISLLQQQIDLIDSVKTSGRNGQDFVQWRHHTQTVLQRIFQDEKHVNTFKKISFSLLAITPSIPEYKFEEAFQRGMDTANSILTSIIQEVIEFGLENGQEFSKNNPIRQIENICNRFHLVARQLRARYNDRETLDIEDEYDVQDLLHAILHTEFDDIRPEEWTPSYAGKSSRMDFLLKNEQIIIEVKKTRKGLTDKEVGDQLSIDINRYQAHPDCKYLICFVYDPEGRIRNPRGLENDLSKQVNEMKVITIISPTGL